MPNFSIKKENKMFNYRKLSLLLAAVMLLSVLAGCGGTNDSPSETNAQVSDTQQAQDADSNGTDAQPNDQAPSASGTLDLTSDDSLSIYDYVDSPYSLPLFPGEDVSFSMWVSFSDNMSTFMPNQYDDNQGAIKAEELTGVHIDFSCVSAMANSEKFNLAVVAQELPDIITGVAQLWSSGFDSAIDDGVFLNLTDMVENYMPVYKSYYDTLDESVKADLHTDSGYFPKLIALNYDYAEATEGPMIRLDYLAAVGLDIPVTYDDWDTVLHAFKDQLGISQPLMLPKGIVHTSNSLVSGFDVLGTFSTFPMSAAPWYQVDGVAKFGILEDGYREYIEMIAGWYADGIISPDFLSINDNPMGSIYTAEITSGNAGIFFGDGAMLSSYVSSGTATNPDFSIWALTQPVKEEGQTTHFGVAKSPISGRLANISISADVGNLEKLGTYLDWYFTKDGGTIAAMGVEGQTWVNEGGTLVYSDEWLTSSLNDGEKPTYYIFSVVPCLYPLQTPESEEDEATAAAPGIWETNVDSAYTMPESLSLTTVESEESSSLFNDIQTYLEENITKFVVGEKPMSEWDSFIQGIYGMDIERLIAIRQDALDRYYSR